MGGMPHKDFSEMYYLLVLPIITNLAGISGSKEYSVFN